MAPGTLESLRYLMIGQPLTDGSHLKRRVTPQEPKTGTFSGNVLPLSPRYSTGPIINSDAMMETIWHSPMVSRQLSPKDQSLLTGTMLSTRQIAQTPYLTPADLARLTAGMGVGYASGLVAGKVLGTLTGMPPEMQKTLARTGMYAGALKSVLPMIFGIR